MRMTPEREEKVRQVERFLKEKIEPILQQDEKANELKQTHNYRLLSYNCTQFICNVIGESVKFHNNQSILKDSFLDLMTETFPRKSTKKVREIKKVYGL